MKNYILLAVVIIMATIEPAHAYGWDSSDRPSHVIWPFIIINIIVGIGVYLHVKQYDK